MTKQEGKVPSLRFPEFEGEWNKYALLEMSEGKLTNGVFNDPKKVGSGYRVINVKDMYIGDYIDVNSLTFLDLNEKEFGKNKVNYGDLFFTRSSIVKEGIAHTNVCLSHDDDITYDGHLIRMRPRQDMGSPLFLAYFFTTRFARKQLISRGKTTTMTTIGQEDIASVYIVAPQKNEQQKIADFLTAVDKRIAQLEEKKRLLTEYKKGVMQQIFSQQIRFTDDNGNPYPDWEDKRLGDVVSFKMTNSLSRNALNYKCGQVLNIHYGDIHTKFQTNFHLGKENVPYINEDIDLSKISVDCYCQVGDLIIADASEDYQDIGKSIEIIETNGQTLLAGLHTYLARPENDKVALGFLGYLIKARYVRLQIMRFAQGVSVLGISKGNMRKITVKIPSFDEQQKIADFLTSIDNKIEQVGAQLEQAKAFKKGLLQKMFV